MSETEQPLGLPRPLPRRAGYERGLAWARWFGWSRLIGSAVSIVVVMTGAMWLLRSPVPAAETTLPIASGGVPPTATLPPPSTAARTSVPDTAPGAASVPMRIVVHVAGAVARPGIVTLPGAARVADAVSAAGGVAPDGDLDAVNLAAPVIDGQRVYVPVRGEIDPASVPSGVVVAPGDPGVVGPIDLNTADVEQLDALPGVGPATAAAIVDDRGRNGPFASVDDLDRVPGIGPAKLEALRDLVRV